MFLPKVSPNKSPQKNASLMSGRMTGSVAQIFNFTVKELAGPSTSSLQDKPDDAFSFTDDEEPEPSIVPPPSKPANIPKVGLQSVYVPTTVNSSENESDLLKHVVPKKRHLVQKNVVEQADSGVSTVHNQFTSSVLADDGATPQTSSSSSSWTPHCFLKSEYAEDNDCVCLELDKPKEQELPLATCFIKIEEPDEQKQEGEAVRSNELARPILPKLRWCPGRKRKSGKKKDKDKDWVMAGQEKSKKEKHKKKKHKKHKKEKRRKSMDCEMDPTSSPNHFGSESSSRRASLIDDNLDSSLHSRKRRLVNKQWNGSEETQCDTSFVTERLKCFSKADGRSLPKGTFLVVKEEAFKSDCPLWKVDNQNLLQKYLPLLLNQPTAADEHVEEIRRYKNSSTYAGWCDQIADEYLIVEIRYVKHSRSENIIEPVIPIADLIPAISSEIAGQSVVKTEEELRRERQQQSIMRREWGTTVKSTNDWNFLCALDEFDQKNGKARHKISNKVKWLDEFQAAINNYTNLYTHDGDNLLVADTCQACANADISAIIQLFTQETYNRDTLLVYEPNFGDVENSCLPAVVILTNYMLN
uniref:Uncharacterized protein n=1 Tax=Ditylenchus dipsaci TaxID=166011 RepID=A0A915EQP7_9BILA